MPPLPPNVNPLSPQVKRLWLPPIRFGSKPYRTFGQSFDQALAELEARYPSHRRMLTKEVRQKLLRRKPK